MAWASMAASGTGSLTFSSRTYLESYLVWYEIISYAHYEVKKNKQTNYFYQEKKERHASVCVLCFVKTRAGATEQNKTSFCYLKVIIECKSESNEELYLTAAVTTVLLFPLLHVEQ